MKKCLKMGCVVGVFGIAVLATAETVENVTARQNPISKQVEVYYDLVSQTGGRFNVDLYFNGSEGGIDPRSVSGDVGIVLPGRNKRIVWNPLADMPNYTEEMQAVVTAERLFKPGEAGFPAGFPLKGIWLVEEWIGERVIYHVGWAGDAGEIELYSTVFSMSLGVYPPGWITLEYFPDKWRSGNGSWLHFSMITDVCFRCFDGKVHAFGYEPAANSLRWIVDHFGWQLVILKD